jgi:peptidoglycan/xylan/chitin deacetylase (PgdA/CDA1 family)
MKSRNRRLATIVLCALTVGLVWSRTSIDLAGQTGGPGTRVAAKSSGDARRTPLEDAPAASPGAAGPSSTTGDDWPLPTPPVGATASSRPGSSTLVASSVRPAGFAIRIPVFMYHRIAPDNEVGASLAGLVVKPEQFAAQMDALELAGWHAITARTLANDLAAGRQPPRHSFVVTLDDGHEDGYTYAYPILRRDGFLATYFVITDRIGHTGYLSVRELRTMVAAGMEIASHTIRHADLTHLAPGGVRAELTGSAGAIDAAVGTGPMTFAYPFGFWDRRLAAALRATGYRMAFIEGGACADVTWPSRFWVPRLRVEPTMSAAGALARAQACAG